MTSLVMTNCLFVDNIADEGGAVFLGEGHMTVQYCTFINNTATTGGGIKLFYLFESDISNCTFFDNTATQGAAVAVEMWQFGSTPLSACLLAFNTGGEALSWDGVGELVMNNMDLYSNEGGDWTGSIADQLGQNYNISVDPWFCGQNLSPPDLAVMDMSACLSYMNPGGVQIGAHGCGCPGPAGADNMPGRDIVQLDNYPNPFNPETTLSFTLAATTHVQIDLYDLTGRLIVSLVDRSYAAGSHNVSWQGKNNRGQAVPSGTYLAILKTDQQVVQRKLALIR